MALLLWANLTGIALFLGIAFTAQLEARRASGSGPGPAEQRQSMEEQTDTTRTICQEPQTAAMATAAELDQPLP
jgi:uncharacterized BrkB/YihY/UPF0761 family membrane protein